MELNLILVFLKSNSNEVQDYQIEFRLFSHKDDELMLLLMELKDKKKED